MISKYTSIRQNNIVFIELTDIHKMRNIHAILFPSVFTEILVHCPHHIEPVFVVGHRLLYSMCPHIMSLNKVLYVLIHIFLDSM